MSIGHGHGGQVGDPLFSKTDGPGDGGEAHAIAGRTGGAAAVHVQRSVVREVVDMLHCSHQSLPGTGDLGHPPRPPLVLVAVFHGGAVSVEESGLHGLGLVLPALSKVRSKSLCDVHHHRIGHGGEGDLSVGAQGKERPGELCVWVHHALGNERLQASQAVAGWAGALGGVERKEAGLQLGQGEVRMVGTGPHGGVGQVLPAFLCFYQRPDPSLGHLQGPLHGLQEAVVLFRYRGEPIYDDLQGVLFVPGQGDVLVQGANLPINAGANPAGLTQLVQLLLVLTLSVSNDWSQHLHASAGSMGAHGCGNLSRGERCDRSPALRAMGRAQPRHEQAQVIEDLRHGAHGGSGVAADGSLIDGEGGGEPGDAVHVWLVHAPQELSGVGGEALQVSALPLLVDGVEGQGGLSRAGQTGKHHESILGNVEIYILEVVLSSACDDDSIGSGCLHRV